MDKKAHWNGNYDLVMEALIVLGAIILVLIGLPSVMGADLTVNISGNVNNIDCSDTRYSVCDSFNNDSINNITWASLALSDYQPDNHSRLMMYPEPAQASIRTNFNLNNISNSTYTLFVSFSNLGLGTSYLTICNHIYYNSCTEYFYLAVIDTATNRINYGSGVSLEVTKWSNGTNITAIMQMNRSQANLSIFFNGTYFNSTIIGNDFITGDYWFHTFQFDDGMGYLDNFVIWNGTLLDAPFLKRQLNLNIFSQATGERIYQNISVKIISNSSEYIFYTNNSILNVSIYSIGEHTIEVSPVNQNYGWNNAYYIIQLSNYYSTYFLDAYLSVNGSSTSFIVSDKETASLLSDVVFTAYLWVVDSYKPIMAKYTDITGNVDFKYITNRKYKFFFSKPGYKDEVFYLDPVAYPSYNVLLVKSTSINATMQYDHVAINYYPTKFQNGSNNLSFFISNPYGELVSYGVTLSFPGGTESIAGSNAIGELLSVPFNITNANVSDRVRMDYWYLSSIAGLINSSAYFDIIIEPERPTFSWLKSRTFGLGILERIGIVTFIVLLVVGISSLVGKPAAGGALGLFVFVFFVIQGFIPIWAVLIPITVGLVILGNKPGGT